MTVMLGKDTADVLKKIAEAKILLRESMSDSENYQRCEENLSEIARRVAGADGVRQVNLMIVNRSLTESLTEAFEK